LTPLFFCPESLSYIVDKETNLRYIKTEVIVDKETIFAFM